MNDTTRRAFLRALGVGAIVAPFASAIPLPAAARAQPKGSKIRYGLVTYQWAKDWDLKTLLANCEKTKVLGVELRTTHKHGVETKLDATQRAEVKKRFADSPVELVGLGSNERFDSPDPEKLAQAIEVSKSFVRLSHDVGASGVKVKPNSFHDGVAKEKTLEQIGKAMATLAKFGADFGQEIRLEVHGQCAKLSYMKQILEIADHPNAKICWNSNKDDLAGRGLEHNFGLVSKYFGRTAHARSLVSDSDYPYDKLLQLFVAMDYDGWFMLEDGRVPKDPLASLDRSRALFERMLGEARRRG